MSIRSTNTRMNRHAMQPYTTDASPVHPQLTQWNELSTSNKLLYVISCGLSSPHLTEDMQEEIIYALRDFTDHPPVDSGEIKKLAVTFADRSSAALSFAYNGQLTLRIDEPDGHSQSIKLDGAAEQNMKIILSRLSPYTVPVHSFSGPCVTNPDTQRAMSSYAHCLNTSHVPALSRQWSVFTNADADFFRYFEQESTCVELNDVQLTPEAKSIIAALIPEDESPLPAQHLREAIQQLTELYKGEVTQQNALQNFFQAPAAALSAIVASFARGLSDPALLYDSSAAQHALLNASLDKALLKVRGKNITLYESLRFVTIHSCEDGTSLVTSDQCFPVLREHDQEGQYGILTCRAMFSVEPSTIPVPQSLAQNEASLCYGINYVYAE